MGRLTSVSNSQENNEKENEINENMNIIKTEVIYGNKHFWDICRICGEKNEELVSIYHEGDNLQLEDMINNYLPITVSKDDELPLSICYLCISKLNTTHDLIVLCIEANEKFELLKSQIKNFHENSQFDDQSIITRIGENSEDFTNNNSKLSINGLEKSNIILIPSEKDSEKDILNLDIKVQPNEEQMDMTESNQIQIVVSRKPKRIDYKNVAIENRNNNNNNEEYYCTGCGIVCSNTEMEKHVCVQLVKENIYICLFCKQDFPTIDLLREHEEIHINDQIFVCTKCDEPFTRSEDLEFHESSHSDSCWPCAQCNALFPDQTSLEVHLNIHDKNKPFLCDTCGKCFSEETDLKGHRCKIEIEVCEICNKAFKSKLHLRSHMIVHNSGSTFPCKHCPRIFLSKERLKQHEAIHSNIRPHQCSICSMSFIRKGNLIKHIKTHSGTKDSCNICLLQFNTEEELQEHRSIHTAEELALSRQRDVMIAEVLAAAENGFHCKECTKSFSSKTQLDQHIKTHYPDKSYQCTVCSKRYPQKSALKYHSRQHTGERPHSCQFCGKGFSSKIGKESHERIHTGEKPYKCSECGTCFRCTANLRQHMLTHSDEKPFLCHVCNKLFRRRDGLQVHMRIHTGERPFACPVCNKSFTQKGDMIKHTRSHSKPARSNDFECSACGQSFPSKKLFRIHRCDNLNNTNTLPIQTDEIAIALPEITIPSENIQEFNPSFQV